MVSNTKLFDVAVVGGGINGVGIARDLAGRGLRVVLLEKDDLASHTSSASTKLIHGGLRYLEQFEFSLVRKALVEREILLGLAPHITKPLRFVMPHHAYMRSKWVIKAGMFLYDHLAHREVLPQSEQINLKTHPFGAALLAKFETGFVYSDGWVDDARLVALCALDAKEHGAQILTYTKLIRAQRMQDHWQLTAQPTLDVSGETSTQTICAKILINAAGPWVEQVFSDCLQQKSPRKVRWIKGSHIVVPRLYKGDHAYILQNDDQRIMFVIPYEQKFTLIGTTDIEYDGDLDAVAITHEEIDYLCRNTEQYLNVIVSASDVVHHFAGVRPLVDDGSQKAADVTRDYQINSDGHVVPVISIFGGKLTTFRKLAQDVANLVCDTLKNRTPDWTAQVALPGGAIPDGDVGRFFVRASRRYPWLDSELLERWCIAYGSRVYRMLEKINSKEDLGNPIVDHVYACEISYLIEHEFVKTLDDLLWRRTKLGLYLSQDAKEKLIHWLVRYMPNLVIN